MATATPGLLYGGPGDVRNIHTIRQKNFYRKELCNVEGTYAFLDDLYEQAYAFLNGSISSKYTSDEKDSVIEYIVKTARLSEDEVDDDVIFMFDRAVTILCCFGDKLDEVQFQAESLKNLYEEIVGEFF